MSCPDEPRWIPAYRSEEELPELESITYVKKLFNEDVIILGEHIVPDREIIVD